MWLDNWENDLVELGTAVRDPISSKVSIPEEQLKNIGNFDETCLSLDGSNNNRRGRPECVIYDPRFPLVGKATSKSALTTTMISGSTAAGDRGCTGDFSKKKIYSNTFFSQCKLENMVCPMKSHQGIFQTKSFSCVICAVSRVFFCFAGKNAFLDGFLVLFTVVRALVWLLDPPLFYRLFRAPIMYIYFYIVYFIK